MIIIFQGRKFQSLWQKDMALPNTFYGVTINGWMETDALHIDLMLLMNIKTTH